MHKIFLVNSINIFLNLFYNYASINYCLFQSIFLFIPTVLIKLIYDMKKAARFNTLLKLK